MAKAKMQQPIRLPVTNYVILGLILFFMVVWVATI